MTAKAKATTKRGRGRPPKPIPADKTERARNEAKAQIARRDQRDAADATLEAAQREIEILPVDSVRRLHALNMYRDAQSWILELEAQGCAHDGETEDDATIRILSAAGHGRRAVHRAVLNGDGGGSRAADRAGIEERKRIPERRAFWGEVHNMPKWCRDAQLPEVKVRKLDGALALLKRGWTDSLAPARGSPVGAQSLWPDVHSIDGGTDDAIVPIPDDDPEDMEPVVSTAAPSARPTKPELPNSVRGKRMKRAP